MTNSHLSFRLRCIPPKTTSQMKRLNRKTGRFFKSDAQEEAETTFAALLIPHRPPKPLLGPLGVAIEIEWPYLAATPKGKRSERLRHISKPDCDNWVKGFVDQLVTLNFIENDQCICELQVSKYHGGCPGIGVAITEIRDGA